jgi:hypothetical protein
MAKGAANEKALGVLHSKLAGVFTRVLETYQKRLDALEQIDLEDIADDMLQELFKDDAMPNPAMLNAVGAFLKQNEIRFDDEQVDKISALQHSLNDRRKNRASNVVELTRLTAIGED